MRQTQGTLSSESITDDRILYMAMELSQKTWKLALSDGRSNPRHYSVDAGDRATVLDKIAKAKARFGLDPDVAVVSCYEAGRDGFWIHRWLESEGIDNHVVDSSSIEVSRRARRAKTDGLDAGKLLAMLIRYLRGEKTVWSVVRVPSVEEEDARRPHRELERLKKERTQHTNRIRALLALHGIRPATVGGRGWQTFLDSVRLWDGAPLPEQLKEELAREGERLEQVRLQIRQVQRKRREALADPQTEAMRKVVALTMLRGIGPTSAWEFCHEMFGWRQFRNRKEVGAYAGLTPTPYNSGDSQREQGISKAGNRRVRKLIIQIAWCWLRYQPQSELSLWYHERFATGGARMRRIGIVALARKLLIALWRYVEDGEIPAGAELKGTATA